jgi:hypothetical protein
MIFWFLIAVGEGETGLSSSMRRGVGVFVWAGCLACRGRFGSKRVHVNFQRLSLGSWLFFCTVDNLRRGTLRHTVARCVHCQERIRGPKKVA